MASAAVATVVFNRRKDSKSAKEDVKHHHHHQPSPNQSAYGSAYGAHEVQGATRRSSSREKARPKPRALSSSHTFSSYPLTSAGRAAAEVGGGALADNKGLEMSSRPIPYFEKINLITQ
eukprot:TRINITY_DN3003_c0_g2_i1.p1 TRINITY_DN3003_c0_g2~~TRINITY_DN3003_c0_g2_i1.p1  ORF type:complete len:119 (+),score=12.02 TRINITY_DN3003_c0_g2_i1:500-856(+)